MMVILTFSIFWVQHYNAIAIYCLVSVTLCCYTKANVSSKSNGVMSLHIFRNQVGVITMAVPPAPLGYNVI